MRRPIGHFYQNLKIIQDDKKNFKFSYNNHRSELRTIINIVTIVKNIKIQKKNCEKYKKKNCENIKKYKKKNCKKYKNIKKKLWKIQKNNCEKDKNTMKIMKKKN